MTFAEAFAKARKEQGPGGTFTYKGKKYTTDRADDKAKVTKNNVEKKTDVKPKKKPVEKKTPTKDRKEKRETKKETKEEQSLLTKAKNLIPPNMRQFVYDMTGGKEDFTEKDLSASDQELFREIISNAVAEGRDYIDYDDYGIDSFYRPFMENITDPRYNLKTLVGRGNFEVDEAGNLILTDKYDFNVNDPLSGSEYAPIADASAMDIAKDLFSRAKEKGIYNALRTAGSYFGSAPGEGSDVRINLGDASGIMGTQAAKDVT